MSKNIKSLQVLSGYYGILQSVHLLALIRAGLILLRTGTTPFPAPAPDAGWSQQAVYFLVGMGLVDSVAITMGLLFTYRLLLRGSFAPRLGLISITIACVSAVIFAIGTFPSGAWSAHPIAYGLMVVLFAPVLPLYFILLNR